MSVSVVQRLQRTRLQHQPCEYSPVVKAGTTVGREPWDYRAPKETAQTRYLNPSFQLENPPEVQKFSLLENES